MEENEPTYKEKHPYFEWIVISIFLIILASGLYLIKPSVTPQKEFNTQPFEFTKVTEKERIKTPEPAPIEMAKSTPQAVQPKTVEAIKETTEITAVPAQPIAIQPARVQYQTIPGDTLWEIAKTHYSGPYFWPVIYQVNINKLTNPDSLEVGITLELPSFKTVFDNLSPDEKPIVAESYYQVYQVYKDLGLANAETYLTVSQTF